MGTDIYIWMCQKSDLFRRRKRISVSLADRFSYSAILYTKRKYFVRSTATDVWPDGKTYGQAGAMACKTYKEMEDLYDEVLNDGCWMICNKKPLKMKMINNI